MIANRLISALVTLLVTIDPVGLARVCCTDRAVGMQGWLA